MQPTTDQLLQVVIYGANTSGKDLVVRLVRQFLDSADLTYELRDSQDVGEFIRKKLQSVPAIEADGVIYPLKENGSFSKSLRGALNAMLSKSNYGNMDKIVVPVDFTPVSTNAFMYAHRLATDLHAVTKAVHVYCPSSTELVAATKEVGIDLEVNRQQQLQHFISQFDVDWGSDILQVSLIDSELRTGFPVEEILHSVEENGAKMIVMGTTGDSGWNKKWLGSVSTELLELAPAPLLLVPAAARYVGVSDILYAYDDISLDKKVMPALVDFARNSGANIHLVHVDMPGSPPDPGYSLQQFVQGLYPAHKVITSSVTSTDVSSAILEYAVTNKISIVSVAAKGESFFHNLMHRSTTQSLGLYSELPLLVMH